MKKETFEEVMNKIFQTFDEEDINTLKELIELKNINDNVKKHFDKSFKNFKSDLESRKQKNDEEGVIRRIYSYIWELILLYASLDVPEFHVKDFSFSHNKREKDLLLTFNSQDYHIEITSKDDINRSKEEKRNLLSEPIAKELDPKNIIDNSNFDYDLTNKFDIKDTEKVLFIYNMKSDFFNLEKYIESIDKVAKEKNFKYILFNNLSSTKGRFPKLCHKHPNQVHAWHNFDNNDCFLNLLMGSILSVLKKLKNKNEKNKT